MLHLGQAQTPNRPLPSTASTRPSGQIYGALINLSGRRRFTSQRVVLYAVLAHQGRAGALELSRSALGTFCDAHTELVKGSSVSPGLFCEELKDVYFGSDDGEKVIQEFIALARRAHVAIEGGNPAAQTVLDGLIEGATPLLAVLNKITQVYEDLAVRHAATSRTQLSDVLSDIESIAKHARIVAFNAQVAASRAGSAGVEFAVVAGELSVVTTKIDELVRQAMRASAA